MLSLRRTVVFRRALVGRILNRIVIIRVKRRGKLIMTLIDRASPIIQRKALLLMARVMSEGMVHLPCAVDTRGSHVIG